LAYLQHWGILTNQVALTEGQLTINGNHYSANLKDSLTRTALEKFALGAQINNGRLIHAGFFVGTKEFYNRLHRMPTQERDQIKMTSVSFTNQLLGNEALKLAQRKHARFINATMKMTLLGAAVSDGLADGNVVSGVGGQYNFVAMAHDLPEARSILMMRSVRYKGKKVFSNIVFNYGHTTIPRHLRDIVITEYGIADLRGKTDEGIIDALLRVTDSRFQSQLIKQAKKAGKLAKSYKLPKSAKNNIPDSLNQHIAPIQDHFGQFPFGSELTEDELMIAAALKGIVRQLNRKWPIAISLLRRVPADKVQRNIKYLERMKLVNANTIKQRIYRKLLLSELN
jgi:acyl-CoA hydrolase